MSQSKKVGKTLIWLQSWIPDHCWHLGLPHLHILRAQHIVGSQ